jgi:hypothetical protein
LIPFFWVLGGFRTLERNNIVVNPHHAEQPTLFDLSLNGTIEAKKNGNSTFADPAFASNKSAPIHRWVPWIAGFSREFVQGAFKRHLQKKGTVLDPFAGDWI